MRIIGLLLFILSVSCGDLPVRSPSGSMSDLKLGQASPRESESKILISRFPGSFKYYVILHVLDHYHHYVDVTAKDIVLKKNDGTLVEFDLERNSVGRYYLKLKPLELDPNKLRVFVERREIKSTVQFEPSPPDAAHTKIRLVKNKYGRSIFELDIRDKDNRRVDLISPPEIIIDTVLEIRGIKKKKNGLWKFSLVYSDQNFVGYISVRANGVYMSDLFRFHHVEK